MRMDTYDLGSFRWCWGCAKWEHKENRKPMHHETCVPPQKPTKRNFEGTAKQLTDSKRIWAERGGYKAEPLPDFSTEK